MPDGPFVVQRLVRGEEAAARQKGAPAEGFRRGHISIGQPIARLGRAWSIASLCGPKALDSDHHAVEQIDLKQLRVMVGGTEQTCEGYFGPGTGGQIGTDRQTVDRVVLILSIQGTGVQPEGGSLVCQDE